MQNLTPDLYELLCENYLCETGRRSLYLTCKFYNSTRRYVSNGYTLTKHENDMLKSLQSGYIHLFFGMHLRVLHTRSVAKVIILYCLDKGFNSVFVMEYNMGYIMSVLCDKLGIHLNIKILRKLDYKKHRFQDEGAIFITERYGNREKQLKNCISVKQEMLRIYKYKVPFPCRLKIIDHVYLDTQQQQQEEDDTDTLESVRSKYWNMRISELIERKNENCLVIHNNIEDIKNYPIIDDYRYNIYGQIRKNDVIHIRCGILDDFGFSNLDYGMSIELHIHHYKIHRIPCNLPPTGSRLVISEIIEIPAMLDETTINSIVDTEVFSEFVETMNIRYSFVIPILPFNQYEKCAMKYRKKNNTIKLLEWVKMKGKLENYTEEEFLSLLRF